MESCNGAHCAIRTGAGIGYPRSPSAVAHRALTSGMKNAMKSDMAQELSWLIQVACGRSSAVQFELAYHASEVFDLKPTSVESRDFVESRSCRASRNY
jgi:hypothetical protein